MYQFLVIILLFLTSGCAPDKSPRGVAPRPVNERCVFLAVGRQGYGNAATQQVALSMEKVAHKRKDVNFSLLLGDNYYPAGVSSVNDPQWISKFESLYGGPYLRGMPFYVVAGNHDHQGSIKAEIEYSRRKLGSGRWQMSAPYYAKDFGEVDGRPLVRVVFLDSVTFLGLGTDDEPLPPSQITRDEQIKLLRDAFSPLKVQPYWKVVAAHYPSRSLTKNIYSEERVMKVVLPVLVALGVDLYLSANDRFQQVLDIPGEPLHVSVNGGGEKTESISALDTPEQLVVPQPGFALITIDKNRANVELFNAEGELSYSRARTPLNHMAP